MPPRVLITGASKGIGLACARRLADHGFQVLAGVRSEEDAAAIRSEAITPITLDVTDSGAVARAAETVAATVGDSGLQGLVNNAGLVLAGPLEGVPLEDLRHQFEVNVFGVVAVTQAMLPHLRAGAGRIVNISSINGRVAVPFAAPYAASKFALEAISDGFRMELSRWNIPVTVVQPGAVDTPIWETSARRAEEVGGRMSESARDRYAGILKRVRERGRVPRHAIPADRVAAVVEKALTVRRPATRYLVGRDARLAAFARFLLPDRLMDRLIMGRGRRR